MSQDTITLPAAADFHLHLRQDEMMRMVTPMVSKGGVSLAYIMVCVLVMRGVAIQYYANSKCSAAQPETTNQ